MTDPPAPHMTTILVVDDDPAVRKLLRRTLRSTGCRILTASDGQKALKKAAREKADLAVLDLNMPGLSGLETMQRLLSADPGLVVIVLTGYGTIESAREAMRLGAYDYVTKPFEVAFLKEVIADSLCLKHETAAIAEQ